MREIPLARYLVPGCEGEGEAGAGPGGRLAVALPTYLADQPVMDLRHIADGQRLQELTAEERARWGGCRGTS
jgi:hypothetical protein